MPVAFAKQSYDGVDFIKVAVDIMREAKRNNVFNLYKELIASTLVNEFDKKQNPKLNPKQRQALMTILTGKSMLFRI